MEFFRDGGAKINRLFMVLQKKGNDYIMHKSKNGECM